MAKLPTRAENYSEWYNQLVEAAGLAEHSAVRGCMIIKPYGYAIWEKMQAILDKMFKDTGHQNAYFPLFIPKSFFNKEAKHVEGFAKECAVVTHYRLKNDRAGNLIVDEEAKLEEELIIRPTSETIIWHAYKKWIGSYRDLPLLINQWANVVRWEMRPRLFLRTAEFLWQEGHTAHATAAEAQAEARQMLDVYVNFVENWLAMPVIKGTKTANERFAGAVETYTLETMTQDGKALQAGTSHFLGQNFAKAFDVQFTDASGKLDYVWATSWGVSTRLMGALVMAHADDNGLVLPPKLAPIQAIIVPIYQTIDQLKELDRTALNIKQALAAKNISVQYDNSDNKRPGWKFAESELKGVPIRLGLGPKDLAQGTIEVARRDTLTKESWPINDIANKVEALLREIQTNLFTRATKFTTDRTRIVDTYEELKEVMEQGGFALAHWDGTTETELKIKEETKATIRCIPADGKPENGKCIYSGRPSGQRVIFARAY
ncbi:MAG: proline--tRNA ligase [Candidatus Magasanikbacteria bacterium]|nr:proline--tRNA ligase [Candidatus Magasanikbacteria bacterium]